jgi:nucleotide-binding universal stress UspA family protein
MKGYKRQIAPPTLWTNRQDSSATDRASRSGCNEHRDATPCIENSPDPPGVKHSGLCAPCLPVHSGMDIAPSYGMRPLALATVVAATDLSPSSDIALATGHQLANAAGAALHVVHVYDSASHGDDAASARMTLTGSVAEIIRRAGIPEGRAKVHVVAGDPAEAIRAVSAEVRADVIVVGPHRGAAQSGDARRLGGTARAIAVGACAPCLAAVQPLPLPLKRVLVPVDLSDTARGAQLVGLSWASALRAGAADARQTTLLALHVQHVQHVQHDGTTRDTQSLERELDTVRRSAGTWAGVGIEGVTVDGDADVADAIARYANDQQVDLVVLGTRGLGLDEVERLGSVSGLVVERSPAAVLLVPPSVWREHLAG